MIKKVQELTKSKQQVLAVALSTLARIDGWQSEDRAAAFVWIEDEIDRLEYIRNEVPPRDRAAAAKYERIVKHLVSIKEHDVIQIRPGAHEKWGGAFAVVDEVHDLSVVANAPEPGCEGGCHNSRKIYLADDEYDRIGRTRWVSINANCFVPPQRGAWLSPEEWQKDHFEEGAFDRLVERGEACSASKVGIFCPVSDSGGD